MYVTNKLSQNFDPSKVIDPERRGGVAWSQFNESFEELLERDWRRVNEGKRYPLHLRLLRLASAFIARKRDAILDLRGKARALWQLPIPRDPDVVFFGAEAGWEALLLRALFGDRGKCVLIDSDPAAYARYLHAPEETRVAAPRGFPEREIIVRRDRSKIEYVKADYFEVRCPREFDVGIDWGLIEHYDDERKLALMENFQSFLKDGGIEVSSSPRDTLAVRIFYYAFRDELNFGYRELLTLRELCAHLERGGYEVAKALTLPAHNVVAARVRHRA